MDNEIFVSIIVPVYNTPEPLLHSCIESVKKQSNPSWELIVMDDGSSDENAKMIDRLCSEIPNTKVFHKENGGVSSARNETVKYACGDWVTFLDSDNTLPQDAVQIYSDTVKSLKDKDADMVIGFCARGTRVIKDGLDIITLDNEKKENVNNDVEIINDKNELVNHLLTNRVKRWANRTGYFADGPVSKLVKTELAKSILFPINLKWEEDTVWLLDFVSKCKKIVVISKIVYNTVEYIYSATRRYRPNCLQEFYDVCAAEKEMETLFPDCKNAFAYKRASNILLVSRLYFFHRDNTKTKEQRYQDFLVWCKRKETKNVLDDVLNHLHDKSKRTLIYRSFSFVMKIGCHRLCWNLLKNYCIRREI